MAKVLVLGGGFGGVVAAERLANELGDEHQITLVSRSRNFVFYPALVRVAFAKCEPADVTFNLRRTMVSRRVNFIEAEVSSIDPLQRRVTIAKGDVEGKLQYDYLIFAMGRRLATEKISGFYEHAHHVLNLDKALQFGKAVAAFRGGHAVIGQCPGARLPVPVYETAFALSRFMEECGTRERTRITVVSPEPSGLGVDDSGISNAVRRSLDAHDIEHLSDFQINKLTQGVAQTSSGHEIKFDLLMLLPPFMGSPVSVHHGITSGEYINVDCHMRVAGVDRIYAVGDCVNFRGPKLAHMAVRQAQVAAENVLADIDGRERVSEYIHEMRTIIDEGGRDSIYVQKDIWVNEPAELGFGRFWGWAKLAQEKYWEARHS